MRDYREVAKERRELHAFHPTNRELSADYEEVAVLAEQEFAKIFNLPFDDTLRPGGDGGIDFIMPDGTIVDVKGRKAGKYALSLLIEEGHAGRCDVFVLAKVFLESEVVRLIGWEFAHIIREIPAKAWPREVINHALDEALLRPMNMLVHAKWLNDYNWL